MSQPLSPPASPVPGAIYTETLTGISWVWTGVSWIEGGASSNYSAQIKTGMALTPGFYSGLSSSQSGGGSNLSSVATQYGAVAPTNPSFGQTWIDTSDPDRPVTYLWTDPGSWTKTNDGTTNTYVQATAPTDHEIGDAWFDTSSSQLNIWDGSQWRQGAGAGGGTATGIQTYTADPAVQVAGSIIYNTSTGTLSVSDGSSWVEIDYAPDADTNSILAIAQPTLRVDGEALQAGDIWIDTVTNTINYWDGGQWIRLASATVGDTHSFWYSNAPTLRPDNTSLIVGDIWIDSDDARAYVWDSSVWTPLATASDNNTNSIVGASAPSQRPTSSDTTLQVGDLWVNTTDFSISYFDGLTWTALTAQVAATSDKHSFTGATNPTLTQRPDGNPLLTGDQYINTITGVLSYYDGVTWVSLVGEDTHAFTGTGAAALVTRPDSTALLNGDIYVDDATDIAYYYDLATTTWKPFAGSVGSADTHAFTDTGAPTLTARPDTTALLNGDIYVDDSTDIAYYYDLANTTWKPFADAAGSDTHAFTDAGVPTLTARPDTSALLDGDFYVDNTTNIAYYYDLANTTWEPLSGSSSTGVDYQEATLAGGSVFGDTFPATRSDGSALVTGDLFRSLNTNRTYYYESVSGWNRQGSHNFIDDNLPDPSETTDDDQWTNAGTGNVYMRYNDGTNSLWVQIL